MNREPTSGLVVLVVLALALVAGGAGCKLSGDVDGIIVTDAEQGADTVGGGDDATSGPDDSTEGEVALPDGDALADTTAPGDVTAETAAPGECHPPAIDPSSITLPDSDFAHPFDIAIAGDRVFVANANVYRAGIGPGFVTVIDRTTGTVLNRIPTSQDTPVALAVYGSSLVVVNQGKDRSEGSRILPGETEGGIDILDDVATAAEADRFDRTLVLAAVDTVGIPHTIDVTSDGQAYIGSGSAPAVFVVDVAGCELLRGPDDPLVLGESLADFGSITPRIDGGDRVWLADGVANMVHVYDTTTGTLDAAALAGAPFDVSLGGQGGPVDVDFRAGASPDVLVLLNEAGSVAGIDTSTGAVTAAVWPAGPDSQAAYVDGDTIYILDRGDNALRRGDFASGEEQPAFALLASGDGPNRFAVTDDGTEAWVVNADADTVAVIDLTRGVVTRVLGGQAISGACAAATTAAGALPAEDFAAPSTALFAGGFVVVANTNPDAGGVPGQGFVTVLHADTLATINRIPTSQPNPRHLSSDGRWLYVVNTGVVGEDAGSGLDVAQSDGGIDVIDLHGLAEAGGPTANIVLPPSAADARVGAPGALVLTEDASIAYVGSTTGPFLFKLDRDQCQVLRGADDPIALDDTLTGNESVSLATGGDGKLAVTLATAGRLLLLDTGTDTLDATSYTFDSALVVGAGDTVYRGSGASPDFFVLLSGIATIGTVDTTSALVTTQWTTAGTAPSHMRTQGDYLYLTDAGSDLVRRVHMDNGDPAAPFLVLDAGAGPADVALGQVLADEWRAWVAHGSGNALSSFRLIDGTPLASTQ